ncbi:MAG: hypothetical protein GF344_16435 [Chitinivibrionales bacterium]|nr:hypothetical protein [Chitinivibrionales bacterium]MBD3358284.1 hypothetical protein [Chitinivibrionales bacterium]
MVGLGFPISTLSNGSGYGTIPRCRVYDLNVSAFVPQQSPNRIPAVCFGTKNSSSTVVAFAILMVFVALPLLISSGVHAAVSPAVDSAGDYLMRQRYERAKDFAARRRAEDPSDIRALYAYFTVRHTQILDYESYAVHGEEFLRFLDTAMTIVENSLSSGSPVDTVRHLFYLGNILGSKGIIQAKTGKWFRAAKTATRSVAMLREAKKRDSTFLAALLGVGLFNYYLSQNLGWVPFFKDRTEEGLRDIVAATEAEFPYDYAAMNAYCWILIERAEYVRADSIAREVLADYPRNTIFLRIAARSTLMNEKFDKALRDGRRLRDLTLEREGALRNWSDLLMAYEVMATAALELNRPHEALRIAREALEKEVPMWAQKIDHVQNHWSYLTEMEKKLDKGGIEDALSE